MGDMADMLFNSFFYDDYDEEFYYCRGVGSSNITCQYCEESGLHWDLVDDKWRLFNWDNEQHRCRKIRF